MASNSNEQSQSSQGQNEVGEGMLQITGLSRHTTLIIISIISCATVSLCIFDLVTNHHIILISRIPLIVVEIMVHFAFVHPPNVSSGSSSDNEPPFSPDQHPKSTYHSSWFYCTYKMLNKQMHRYLRLIVLCGIWITLALNTTFSGGIHSCVIPW